MVHARKSEAYYSDINHLKNRETEVRRSKCILKAERTCRKNIYWTAIRVKTLSKAAELELYRDSLEHDYLVIYGVLWFGCS